MSSPGLTRHLLLRKIAENAITITIRRTTLTKASGARTKATANLGTPITVRIAQRNTSAYRQVETAAGPERIESEWVMLAPDTADVKASEFITDQFDGGAYGKFELASVKPIERRGAVCGYLATLRRIAALSD